MFQPDVTRRL